MPFSAAILSRELQSESFGRVCRVVRETGSTIDLARQWLSEGGPEGGVVVADRQSQGRGRLGRPWASPEGGLWMSVIVRPGLPASASGRLGVVVALAAAEAVARESGGAIGLKWPNDIMITQRKVGGVLVDTVVRGSRVEAAVLSLGLNVNLSPQDLPEAIQPTATSLRVETGRDWPLESLAARVLEEMERLWPYLARDGADLAAKWRQYDALAGADVTIALDNSEVPGRAGGIDGDGALILVTDGTSHRVSAGEVRAVKVQGRC